MNTMMQENSTGPCLVWVRNAEHCVAMSVTRSAPIAADQTEKEMEDCRWSRWRLGVFQGRKSSGQQEGGRVVVGIARLETALQEESQVIKCKV